jgi:hypothetical protein
VAVADFLERLLVGLELFFDNGGGEARDLLGQALGGAFEVGAEGLSGLDDLGLVGALSLASSSAAVGSEMVNGLGCPACRPLEPRAVCAAEALDNDHTGKHQPTDQKE